jgi:hypothetical protein
MKIQNFLTGSSQNQSNFNDFCEFERKLKRFKAINQQNYSFGQVLQFDDNSNLIDNENCHDRMSASLENHTGCQPLVDLHKIIRENNYQRKPGFSEAFDTNITNGNGSRFTNNHYGMIRNAAGTVPRPFMFPANDPPIPQLLNNSSCINHHMMSDSSIKLHEKDSIQHNLAFQSNSILMRNVSNSNKILKSLKDGKLNSLGTNLLKIENCYPRSFNNVLPRCHSKSGRGKIISVDNQIVDINKKSRVTATGRSSLKSLNSSSLQVTIEEVPRLTRLSSMNNAKENFKDVHFFTLLKIHNYLVLFGNKLLGLQDEISLGKIRLIKIL